MADWDDDGVGHWDGGEQKCANMNDVSCETLRMYLSELSAVSPDHRVISAHKRAPYT